MSDEHLAGLDAEALAAGFAANQDPSASDNSNDGAAGTEPEETKTKETTAEPGGEGESGAGEPAGEDGAKPEGEGGDDGKTKGNDGEEPGGDEGEQPRKRSGSARWRDRALRAEAALGGSVPAAAATDADVLRQTIMQRIGPPPNEAEFNGDYIAFERAQTAYEAAALSERPRVIEEAKKTAGAHQLLVADRIEAHEDRVAEALKKIPDFKETMAAAKGKISLALPVINEVIDSEKSDLIVYHLAKNPALAAKMNAMAPMERAKQIGRLEATLSYPTPKTATKAPAPLEPVKGSANVAVDPAKMSQSQYEAWRRKQQAASASRY